MLTAMVYDINDRIRSFELITEKVAGDLPTPQRDPALLAPAPASWSADAQP